MPATFLLRALLVDPLRNPLPDVPVRPFAFDLTKNSWGPIGEVRLTDVDGNVELEVTGSPPVSSVFLGIIALRHEETGVVLAEQWWSYTSGDPVILDYGEIRVWDPSLTMLSERTIAGVPAELAEALDDSEAVADLQAQLATLQDQLTSTQAQLATTQGQLTTTTNALATTQSQLTVTQNALVATQGQLTELQGIHAATLAQLADVQGALGQLQSTHAATLEELASVETELAELQANLGNPTSLESVVDSVGEQLQATQSRLAANGSPFQLGRVSLSLKVVPSSSTSFGFATIEQLGSVGGALSTLDLDFAQTTPTPTEPAPSAAVPSLVGLTEPAARRRLAPLGLGASVVHQAIADDGDVALAGRVLKQIPAPGAAIQPGQVVTLVLGKPLEGVAP